MTLKKVLLIIAFTVIFFIILHQLLLPVNLRLQLYGFNKEGSYYYDPNSTIDYHVYIRNGKIYSFTYEHITSLENHDINVKYEFLLEDGSITNVKLNYFGQDISCSVNLVSNNQQDCKSKLSSESIKTLKMKSMSIYLFISRDFPFDKIPKHQIYHGD